MAGAYFGKPSIRKTAARAQRRAPLAGVAGGGCSHQAGGGGGIFAAQSRHQVGGAGDGIDAVNALSAAPDVLPGFSGAAAEIHLARVGLGQVLRVQARSTDRWRQVVAMNAGEQGAVDDLVRG